jgi:hypothetical protein
MEKFFIGTQLTNYQEKLSIADVGQKNIKIE